jgi:hypothetical protein
VRLLPGPGKERCDSKGYETGQNGNHVDPVGDGGESVNKELITKLAEDEFEARQEFEAIGMMNSYGLSWEDGKAQSVKYSLAKARAMEARKLLNQAINDCEVKA